MQAKDRIDRLESRARALNLTLSDLCRASGEHYSNLTRWRNDLTSPTFRVFSRTMERLEAALEAERQRLLKEIFRHDKENAA